MTGDCGVRILPKTDSVEMILDVDKATYGMQSFGINP